MEQINVFALFNTLNQHGSVCLSDCTTAKVGDSFNAVAAPEDSRQEPESK